MRDTTKEIATTCDNSGCYRSVFRIGVNHVGSATPHNRLAWPTSGRRCACSVRSDNCRGAPTLHLFVLIVSKRELTADN